MASYGHHPAIKRKIFFLEKSDWSLIRAYIFGQYLNVALGIVLLVLIAHISLNLVAGYGVASLIYSLLSIVIYGVMTSAGVMVARYLSEGRKKDSIDICYSAIFLGFILSLFCLALFLTSNLWLHIFVHDESVVDVVVHYFYGASIGVVPNVFSIVLIQLMGGLGGAGSIIFSRIFKFLIVPLFLIFLLLWKGQGFLFSGFYLGLSISLGYFLTFLFMSIIFLKRCLKKKIFHIKNIQKKITLDGGIVKKIFFNGFPTGLLFSLELAYGLAVLMILSHRGGNEQAAFYVVTQINLLLRTFPYAVSLAVAFRVAHIGGKKYTVIDLHLVRVLKMLLACCLFIGIALCLMQGEIFRAFPKVYLLMANVEYRHELKLSLLFSFLIFILDSIRFNVLGVLRGVGETFNPMVINVLGLWLVALPLGYFMNYYFGSIFVGFLFGEVIGLFLVAIFLVRHYFLLRRRWAFLSQTTAH